MTLVNSLADRLIEEEQLVCWLYLDTSKPPVVTCGVGHALHTVDDALALPWDHPADQVRADWAAILAAPPGRIARTYAWRTESRLPEAFVRELLERDIADARAGWHRHFPHYDHFPAGPSEALDDLAFNLGPNWPVELRAGIPVWPHLTAAVNAEDWPAAAANCHRRDVSDKRNADTAALFASASTT
jgi:hypothetical protein